MQAGEAQILKSALQWYIDNDVDTILGDEAIDRFQQVEETPLPSAMPTPVSAVQAAQAATPPTLGASEARIEAVKLAQAATTLEELQKAIAEFDGIALKKTATNLVFASGNPKADIMIIGEAPEADEDRAGTAFAGASGALLDKILACIDLDRNGETAENAAYLTNLINWRPPGNRTPTAGEIEASLPFIERHIQLAQPKLLILCGSLSAKTLLGKSEGLSRLRKKWHDYTPQTAELAEGATPIPAIATYHPTYLLRTPIQKRAVWTDMLAVKAKRAE